MQISYSNPFNQAWLRMKSFLFNPLDPGKWFVLGFTAWLAQFDPDFLFSFNFKNGDWGNQFRLDGLSGDSPRWDDFSSVPIPAWSVPILITLAIVGLLIGLVLLWVQCRGKFMFLDNLVHGRSEVVRPWREQASLGDSAFLWQVIFTIVCLVVFGTVAAAVVLGMVVPGLLDAPTAGMIILAILGGTLLFMLSMVAIYTQFFMNRFVIPLMYRDRIGVMEGWRRFLALFGENPLHFVLYGLFYLVVSIVGWLLFLIMGFATCCVGLLLISLPYLGSVLTLPLSVLLRYMDLEFLTQFDGGKGFLSPLPVIDPGPQDTSTLESDQVDGDGTMIRPEDVGPDAGGPQPGPQDP